MDATLERIVSDALAMPRHLRAFLAETLIESLDYQDKFDIDDEWLSEVHARCEQIDAGKVTMLPADEVFKQLRAQVGRG